METFYLLFLCVILKNTDGIKKQKINPFAESLHLPETVNTEKPKFEKIVNGRNAVEGEFPFQVSLQVASATGNHHLCGGSILSEKYVLTAAHCLSNTDPEENPVDVIVSAGIVDIREQNQSCEAESFIVHENFDTETLVNDIAIIKVNPEFVFSDLVSAVRLPEPDQDLSPLTEVELIGWGATQQGATISPSILQKTQSYIYDREQCIFGYMTDGKPMNENIICAYDSIHGSDTCQGDSGGPLLVNKSIQHGIVSWGIGCGTNPGVYTRVSKYINWIKEITSDKDEDSLYIRAKCGQLNEDTNYFNTSRINVYDFSWVAFLRYRTPMTLGVNCSGVLISTHHVLTAAQCVYEQDPQVVTLNEHGLSFPVSCQEAGNGKSLCTDTVQGTIKNIIVHPEYNPKNQKNNLAILKLAENVPEYLNPICLPNKRTKMPKRLSVAGFGNSVDNKKRWSFLDSINSVTCQKRYKTVSEDQICAGLDHGDSCVSDIGGPVFTIERLEDYSFSHTVFGIRTNLVCNGKGNPGVFTKIQPHMKWILSVINDRSFEKLVMQKKMPVNPQQNKFNIRLLRVYEKHTSENFVIGTSNIKLAMMALAEVAAENTRKEIIRNLNLYEGSIDQMVSTLLTPIKGVELHQAIRVWGKDAVVNKNFEGNLNSYGVQLQIVDLDGKVETERAVNDWIKKSTMENFDLNINLQSVESGTKMLLTTAVFFKGIWKYSFQKTTRGCFKLSTLKDGCHDVTYIVNTGLYKYGVNRKLDVEIVEIPYEGDQVSMVVILPFEKELSAINRVAQKLESMSIPNLLANLEEQRVNLEIPKFSLRVQTPMDEYLNFLQLPHLHPKGKFFTKFDDDSIKFSGFVQIAGIEVVQDGTMYTDNNMDIDDTGTEAVEKQFIADKPFIFLVWDKESSEILIAGRLTDPTKKN